MKRKPWDYRGDPIYKPGRSWALDFQHRGQRYERQRSILKSALLDPAQGSW